MMTEGEAIIAPAVVKEQARFTLCNKRSVNRDRNVRRVVLTLCD